MFYDWRFDRNGQPNDFVLNNPKYSGRQIMLARDNFGSGSSREHAVWAILDYGFRAIIAPSFADIFYNNCFKNGLLPVRLKSDELDYLFRNGDLDIEIDLANQLVVTCERKMFFEIDEFRKKLVLEGLDIIGLTLQFENHIMKHERKSQTFAPSL